MEILVFDAETNIRIVENFINDLCSEELKPQARSLLEQQDFGALESLMQPFYNTPV